MLEVRNEPLEAKSTACLLTNGDAQYGGFGFHSVGVKNISESVLSNWEVRLDFGAASPSPQWSWGGDYVVEGSTIVVTGNTSISPGQQITFGIGGNYSGANQISVICD